MKPDRTKTKLLEEFRKYPIVSVACQRANVSRQSFYRWRKSAAFKKAVDAAMAEGEQFLTDMAESQLVTLMRDKHFPAIRMWLIAYHPKFANKMEVTSKVQTELPPLTAKQKALIEKALSLIPSHEED